MSLITATRGSPITCAARTRIALDTARPLSELRPSAVEWLHRAWARSHRAAKVCEIEVPTVRVFEFPPPRPPLGQFHHRCRRCAATDLHTEALAFDRITGFDRRQW